MTKKMEISSIEGLGKLGDGKAFQKAKAAVKQGANFVKETAKDVVDTVVDGAKTIGLAPGRGAFLLLLQFNVRGLASKLAKVNQDKLHNKWNDLGGNFTTLTEAINKGKGKKAVFGTNQSIEGIGEPATIATAIVTAAPILVAILAFLKGENPELVDEELNGITTDAEIAWSNANGGDMSGFDFALQRGKETPSANYNLNNDPGSGAAPSGGSTAKPFDVGPVNPNSGSGLSLNLGQIIKDYWWIPVGFFIAKKTKVI